MIGYTVVWGQTPKSNIVELFLLGVKENLWLHSSQNSFLEYLSHCRRQSWWMNLMDPVQMHGWNSGRSEVPSQRHTRHMSEEELCAAEAGDGAGAVGSGLLDVDGGEEAVAAGGDPASDDGGVPAVAADVSGAATAPSAAGPSLSPSPAPSMARGETGTGARISFTAAASPPLPPSPPWSWPPSMAMRRGREASVLRLTGQPKRQEYCVR